MFFVGGVNYPKIIMANGNAGLFVDWSRSEGGERDGCYIDVLTIEDTQK
jgi:hypothetical protein